MHQLRFGRFYGFAYFRDFGLRPFKRHTLVKERKFRDSWLRIIVVVSSHIFWLLIGQLGTLCGAVTIVAVFTLGRAAPLHIIRMAILEVSLRADKCLVFNIMGHGRPCFDRLGFNFVTCNLGSHIAFVTESDFSVESNLFFLLATVFDFANFSLQHVVVIVHVLLSAPLMFHVFNLGTVGARRRIVDRDKVKEMLRRHYGQDSWRTMKLKVVADMVVMHRSDWKLKSWCFVKWLLTVGSDRSHSMSEARAVLRVLGW